MLSIGVLGINFKTADLQLRESIARGARFLSGERAVFFPHPTVLLSTCNRTEIYFSSDDLARAHMDVLAFLRFSINRPFEHRLYSYFGIDSFAHLCRVAAGIDSAIFAETEIQRQVRTAYARAGRLPSSLHYVFQKALKVSKLVRNQLELKRGSTLYERIWHLAEWKDKRVLLVGFSEINRGLISYLEHKKIKDISLCTRNPDTVLLPGVCSYGRDILNRWIDFDVIVSASQDEKYLISGEGRREQVIFDLSVPRNVDPRVGESARLYNIDHLIEEKGALPYAGSYEALIWENVMRLSKIYRLKIQRAREIVGMELHL